MYSTSPARTILYLHAWGATKYSILGEPPSMHTILYYTILYYTCMP
jgi:hypothetical protein